MTKDCVINSDGVGSEQMTGITDKFHRVWVQPNYPITCTLHNTH